MRGFGGRRKGKEEWICNYIFRNKKKLKKKTMYLILFLSALYRIDEAHERQMTLQ